MCIRDRSRNGIRTRTSALAALSPEPSEPITKPLRPLRKPARREGIEPSSRSFGGSPATMAYVVSRLRLPRGGLSSPPPRPRHLVPFRRSRQLFVSLFLSSSLLSQSPFETSYLRRRRDSNPQHRSYANHPLSARIGQRGRRRYPRALPLSYSSKRALSGPRGVGGIRTRNNQSENLVTFI